MLDIYCHPYIICMTRVHVSLYDMTARLSPLLSLRLFLCMLRLPQQTRNSEVYKAPSEECMQRIHTSEMQKCLTAYLLKFACLPYHSSARSNRVQKAFHRDACVYSTVSTN